MSETPRLICPDETYLDEIRAYRGEFLRAGESMDGCASLRQTEDPMEWLRQVKALSDPASLPPDMVLSTQFCLVRDKRILGMIQVRHTLNAYLEKYAGHIGYSVRPSERRKGYAAGMLQSVLPYCREIGLSRVLITCNEPNEGSRRTILKNGGVYESTVTEENERIERYWIAL